MAGTVSGRDIGSIDQHESATDGLFDIRDMQAQSLADQREHLPANSRYGRLTHPNQITHWA
ncbi:hypothetical protein ACIQPP_48465 [Streptomyces violaceusniger]|uniref:hypothetical protein n=1 Tax=Streptomyces violaceusniger TaxID=68280 RepID=UPI000996EC28|nr:hypothetical protein [Streptomyces hygroscopicus]